MSSGVNALALVFMTDIFKPLYKKITLHEVNEIKATVYSKVVALLYGLLTIGLAFLSQYFGSLILQIALSIFGMVGGPLLALFILALFFPCVNSLVGIIILCKIHKRNPQIRLERLQTSIKFSKTIKINCFHISQSFDLL